MARKVKVKRPATVTYGVNPRGTPDQQDRNRGVQPRVTEDDPAWDSKRDGNKRKGPPRPKIREYRRSDGQWS